MKTVLVGAFWLLIVCTPLLLIVGTFLVIDDEPWIARGYELTPAYIERAEALIRVHDPRKASDVQLRTMQLTGADVDLVANYAASRVGGAMRGVKAARTSSSCRTWTWCS